MSNKRAGSKKDRPEQILEQLVADVKALHAQLELSKASVASLGSVAKVQRPQAPVAKERHMQAPVAKVQYNQPSKTKVVPKSPKIKLKAKTKLKTRLKRVPSELGRPLTPTGIFDKTALVEIVGSTSNTNSDFTPWFLDYFCSKYAGHTISCKAITSIAYLLGFSEVYSNNLYALAKQYPQAFKIVKTAIYEDIELDGVNLVLKRGANKERRRLDSARIFER